MKNIMQLRRQAFNGDRQAQFQLLQYLKSIGCHSEAGYWANKLNLFPDCDFIQLTEEQVQQELNKLGGV